MMRLLPAILLVIGVLATAMGLLWLGQGLGYIQWPASSFMLDQRPWVWRGAVLALFGVLLILRALKRRRRG